MGQILSHRRFHKQTVHHVTLEDDPNTVEHLSNNNKILHLDSSTRYLKSPLEYEDSSKNDPNNNNLLDDVIPPLKVKFHVMPKSVNDENFVRLFSAYGGKALMRTEPGGLVIGNQFEANADQIYHLKLREDDTWIVTFPKSGTTWMQEMAWLLVNNCDTKSARQQTLDVRSPFLELPYMWTVPQDLTLGDMFTTDKLDAMESPRVIKSHLPFYLLPPKLIATCKVIYVARNPKDVIVSYFYHHKFWDELHGFNGNLEEFAQFYIDDEVLGAPYFPHVLDAWSKRHHPNFLFVFYEDMKRNLRGEIEKVAAFLGRSLTEDELVKLTDHLRFDKMKQNETNFAPKKEDKGDLHFVRKGKTGDWKNHFGVELNEKIDNWIESNLAGTDLKFVTELEFQD